MLKVQTITPGLHWLPGQMPSNVLRYPDIANAFMIERAGAVYVVDTGVGQEFRLALRRFFAGRRYASATLITSHLHPDHICNNDLLLEIEAERKAHLIHPAGVAYLDPLAWAQSDIFGAAQAYWPLDLNGSALALLSRLAQKWAAVSPNTAFGFFAWLGLRKFQPIRSWTPYLSTLEPAGRTALAVGGYELPGRWAGDLFLLDDRAHSPDSLAVYDPHHRLLLLSDLTYAYNPLWPSGTYNRMIENLQAYRDLAQTGAVSILGDGHHHRLFQGRDEIVPWLDDLIGTHARRCSIIIETARRLGTEAGGHTGYSGTLPLVPAVIDVVGDIPVVAAGGIADGRGLAAVLMLSAEGAWLGTRFVASREVVDPLWKKERAVQASADDTVLTRIYDLTIQAPFPQEIGDRVLRNTFTDEWHGRDAEVVARRDTLNAQLTAAVEANDASVAPVRVGSATGLITSVEPAGDIQRRIVAEAEAILRRRPQILLKTLRRIEATFEPAAGQVTSSAGPSRTRLSHRL